MQRNTSFASDKTSTFNRAEVLKAQLIARKSGTPSREKPDDNVHRPIVANNSRKQETQGVSENSRKALDIDMERLLEQGKQDAAAKAASSQSEVRGQNNEKAAIQTTKRVPNRSPTQNGISAAKNRSNIDPSTQGQHREPGAAEFDKIERLAASLGFQSKGRLKNNATSERGLHANNITESRASQAKLNASAATFTPSQDPTYICTEHGDANTNSKAIEKNIPTSLKHSSDALDLASRPRTTLELLEPLHAPTRRDDHTTLSVSTHADTTLQYEGLDEWLELTGFHDKAFRERTIRRSRQQKEIETQQKDLKVKLANIKREMYEDIETGPYVVRAQSSQSQLKTERTSPKSMAPPPPFPEKSCSSFGWDSHKPTVPATRPEGQKRGYSPSWDADPRERAKAPRWSRSAEAPVGSSYVYADRPATPRRPELGWSRPSLYQSHQLRRSPRPRAGLSRERRVSGPRNGRENVFDRRDSAWSTRDNKKDLRSHDCYRSSQGPFSRPKALHFRGPGMFKQPLQTLEGYLI